MRTDWASISTLSWLLMAASSILALSFSYMVWYTAVQKIGSARTAIYSNLTPIVAMVVAALWLGEQIARAQVFGTVLILSGLAVTRWRARPDSRAKRLTGPPRLRLHQSRDSRYSFVTFLFFVKFV